MATPDERLAGITGRPLEVGDLDPHFTSEVHLRDDHRLYDRALHVERIPTDTATAGYVKIPVSGKAFWIRQNSPGLGAGALLNRIALNQAPAIADGSVEELRQSLGMTNGMLLATPFKALFYKVATVAAGGFIDIVIFKNNATVQTLDPTTGTGLAVTATASLPVYYALSGTTAELRFPVRFMDGTSNTELYNTPGNFNPVASSARMAHFVPRQHGKLGIRSTTPLGISGNILSTVYLTLVDTDGETEITTLDNDGFCWNWGTICVFSDVGGTLYIDARVAGSAVVRQWITTSYTAAANVSVGTLRRCITGVTAVRFRYLNGGAAQVTGEMYAALGMGGGAEITTT